ncbi:MAG: aldehyde dehydrogenase (NADP(+)) [Planctomycetes bacterium]|nr:aldehyde dehydrogenase (NADP(+)) [Planctomycetota bacterium]
MVLQGSHCLGGGFEGGKGEPFTAFDPMTGQALPPTYHDADAGQVDHAGELAAAAAAAFAATAPSQRAALLRNIAEGLEAIGDELNRRITQETALPAARATAERGRTMLQLRQFADLIEDGSWVDARIDRGDPQRTPLPRPDLRRMLVPLGPVAVFGASNFPLAYSVAGGDTASALAAGCPVVVKAHPAHPGTSELVGRVVAAAVQRLGLPAGTFAMLHGRGNAVGERLVLHPGIAAVGFTGSHQGGRALFDLAARRPSPIPVFAEMGSTNPVLVLPRALAARAASIATKVAESSLLAAGQFCTSPGLLLCIDGPGADLLRQELAARLTAASAAPAVHATIRAGFERALAEVAALPVTASSAAAGTSPAATAVCPTLLQTAARSLLQHPRLRTEIYGPAVMLVVCRDAAELLQVASVLPGNLTATVHGDGDDFVLHPAVLDALRRCCGRLIANGVPTGVEVTPAMVHGGPYPASTDARFSAVGTTSIQRWARPACWQDWPAELLPVELRDDNPRRLRRLVDGRPE